MSEFPTLDEALHRTRVAERAADAELVRAAGCLCWEIYAQRYPKDLADFISPDDGAPHYDECPEALAAAIEARR